MIRVCCLSDLHGHYPPIPDCDLLLLGGDYCRGGDSSRRTRNHYDFCTWIDQVSKQCDVIGIAGNHDIDFQRVGYPNLRQCNWTYLEDESCVWQGLHIHGTPWSCRFFDWAFMDDEPGLQDKWNKIPDICDILVVHGPPYGTADFSSYGDEHCGSKTLAVEIERRCPRLVICGHIHSAYGQYRIGDTKVISSSLVNDRYEPVNPPQVIELDI